MSEREREVPIEKKILKIFNSLLTILLITFLLWVLINIDIVKNIKMTQMPKCFFKTAFRNKNFFVVSSSDCRGLYARANDFLGL